MLNNDLVTSVKVKDNDGNWSEVKDLWRKENGAWQKIGNSWVKDSGTQLKFWIESTDEGALQ